VYLAWSNFAMDPTATVHQVLCKSPAIIRQVLGEESVSHMRKVWLAKTGKGETHEEQSQERGHQVLRRERDWSQEIHRGRPHSQFSLLLSLFTAIAWKCAKTSPRNFGDNDIKIMYRFYQGIFDQEQNDCSPPHPLYSPDLAPCDFSQFSRLMIPPIWHNGCDGGRVARYIAHPHKTQLQGFC
jgi:hypothetical protein